MKGLKKVLSVFFAGAILLSSLMLPISASDIFLGNADVAIKLVWDKNTYSPGEKACLSVYLDVDDELHLNGNSRIVIGTNSEMISQEDNSEESITSKMVVNDFFNSFVKVSRVGWYNAAICDKIYENNSIYENSCCDQYLVISFSRNYEGTHENASNSTLGLPGYEINPNEPVLKIAFKIRDDIINVSSLDAIVTSGSISIPTGTATRFNYLIRPGESTVSTNVNVINISNANASSDICLERYPSGYNFNLDRYSFNNEKYIIEKNIYKKVFGSDKGARLYYIHESKGEHGVCYGMASTTAALLSHPHAIKKFRSNNNYVSNLINISEPELYTNDLFTVDALTYIKYGHLCQFSSKLLKEEKNTKNDINGLYEAVRNYVNGTGKPVVINVAYNNPLARKGHSVFAVGTFAENGKRYILVNDSNISYAKQKMEINIEENTWEYTVNGAYTYNSENSFVTYSFPADTVYNVGLLLNSNISEILSTDSKLVVSSNGVSANCELQEIYATAGTSETDSTTHLYWAEKCVDEIEITATEDNTQISVADNNSSVTVEIDSTDSANFFVNDDSNNSVTLDCSDEENVDITFKVSNCLGNEAEIVVSATANDDNITASLTNNGITISGVSDGDVSVVKYDEIIETKTIVEDENEIEIETELPHTGHIFVDGVCTECGERTIQVEEMSSQIRFTRNDDGSYAGTFDVRTRAMISDEDFTELVGATNAEAVGNIDKIGFVYTLDGENFDSTSAQAVAQGESITGYVNAPVKYIQDKDGYYMFTCLVTGIPDTDKDYTLTAYAYICVNGKWYFSEAPMNADFNSLYETYYPQACEKYGW